MSDLTFRNIDAAPTDRVETWPYEGLVAAIERGSLSDWRRIIAAVRRAPWGPVARRIEEYATYGEEEAVIALLLTAVHRARERTEADERADVARRIRSAISVSGVPARHLAAEVGTSASRLSTYATGTVMPSAGMLMRIERAADRLAATSTARG